MTIAQTAASMPPTAYILNGGTFTNQGAVTATRTLGGNAVTGGTTAATTVVNTTGARIEGQAQRCHPEHRKRSRGAHRQQRRPDPGQRVRRRNPARHGCAHCHQRRHRRHIRTEFQASANGYGVGSDAGGALTLTNDAGGKIVGQYGVFGSNTADSVTNSGTIAAGILNGDGTITAGGRSGIRLRSGGTVMKPSQRRDPRNVRPLRYRRDDHR